MTVLSDTAERLEERLAPYGPDVVLLAYLTALSMLFQRSEEALRWDEHGSGWRRFFDPTRAPEWGLPWLSQLVGSPRLAGLTQDQLRTVVAGAPTMGRGRVATIVAAAQLQMAEGAHVHVAERVDSAYSLLIQTHTSETPDPDLVEAAVRAAKPVGLILTYVCSGALLVGIFEDLVDWPTVADFEADFTDVDDFETYTT